MKKLAFIGFGLCVVCMLSSCKSSESAYKKAYEQAKQQELAEPQAETPVSTASVVTEQTEAKVVESAPIAVRQERVTVVTGDGLKDFSVVCGSFGVKANADALKEQLAAEGYKTLVVENVEAPAGAARYRVIVGTFDDRASAAAAPRTRSRNHPPPAGTGRSGKILGRRTPQSRGRRRRGQRFAHGRTGGGTDGQNHADIRSCAGTAQ